MPRCKNKSVATKTDSKFCSTKRKTQVLHTKCNKTLCPSRENQSENYNSLGFDGTKIEEKEHEMNRRMVEHNGNEFKKMSKCLTRIWCCRALYSRNEGNIWIHWRDVNHSICGKKHQWYINQTIQKTREPVLRDNLGIAVKRDMIERTPTEEVLQNKSIEIKRGVVGI